MIEFSKYQALGNDFILIDAVRQAVKPGLDFDSTAVKALCARRYGIGADGVIFAVPGIMYDLQMILYNSDGSPAEISGNGLRCFALFAEEKGLVKEKKIHVETGGGSVKLDILSRRSVRVGMPPPKFDRKEVPMIGEGECNDCEIILAGRKFIAAAVNIGNPHCVIFEKMSRDEAQYWGPLIENSPYFPEKTNVEFVKIISPETIELLVWERGAGLTEACGSGSCAAVSAGIKTGRLNFNIPVKVKQPGGILTVTVTDDFKEVLLEGEACKVYDGRLEL